MTNKRVVVLGAGISGLSTATLLLQQEKGIDVHLIAKHFPGDLSGEYTSPMAGALWKSDATKDDIRQQKYDEETFNHFWELAKKTSQTGIMIIDGFEYWEQFSQDFSDPWYKTLCPEYRHLKKEELPTGVEFGITYKTVSITPSTHLSYLFDTFVSLGGTTQRLSLSHLNECIDNDTDVVINCTGLHARTLGGVEDLDVYPSRGQTVIVQLPQTYVNWAFLKHSPGNIGGRLANDGSTEMTYVIPRHNGEVVLGGTYDQHNHSTDVDDDIAAAIVLRCLATRPDLLPPGQDQLTIKRNAIGLRPCRKGGIRIEAEWINSEKSGKKILICHNYGHGGAGFLSSYGTAKHVIKVMKETLNPQQ